MRQPLRPPIFPDPANVTLHSVFENYRYRVIADKFGGKQMSLAIDVETDEDITLISGNSIATRSSSPAQ